MLHPVKKHGRAVALLAELSVITQILLESKHLYHAHYRVHLISKSVKEEVLSKAFGWRLKERLLP